MADRPIHPWRTTIFFAAWVAVGLAAFYGLPGSELDRRVASRTIQLGLSASFIAIPLGGLICWIVQSRGLIPKLVLFSSAALLLVPVFVFVSSWDAAFGKLGWLTATQGRTLDPLVSGWVAAAWIHGVAATPQVALIFALGWIGRQRTYEEQALLDATRLTVFVQLQLPRLLPLILLSLIWIVICCSREIAATDLYQVGTLAEQLYLGYSLGLTSIAGNWTPEQLAEANSLGPNLTILLVAWLSLAGMILFSKLIHITPESGQLKPNSPALASTLQNCLGLFLLVILVAVPILNILIRGCFFVESIDGDPIQRYSVGQLFVAIQSAWLDYQNEFIWSLLIALTSSLGILACGLLIVFFGQKKWWLQGFMILSLAISCALPGPYIGTLVGDLFRQFDIPFVDWLFNYTIAAPVVANFIFCWPLGVLLLWFTMRGIPTDTLEHATTEGIGSIRKLLIFGIGGNGFAILGCWIICFACCFGELSASHLVRPAGMDTVPRKMLGDLHAGVNELTAGVTIIITLIFVGLTWGGWLLIWLNRRPHRQQ